MQINRFPIIVQVIAIAIVVKLPPTKHPKEMKKKSINSIIEHSMKMILVLEKLIIQLVILLFMLLLSDTLSLLISKQ